MIFFILIYSRFIGKKIYIYFMIKRIWKKYLPYLMISKLYQFVSNFKIFLFFFLIIIVVFYYIYIYLNFVLNK